MLIRHLRFIGYVRGGAGSVPHLEQVAMINEHCARNGHKMLTFFSDESEPASGLADALAALTDADGLAVVDLTRLVPDNSDPLRHLRPLLTNKFLHGGKKLVSVKDGIENVSPGGQEHLMDLLSEWSRREELVDRSFHQLSTL